MVCAVLPGFGAPANAGDQTVLEPTGSGPSARRPGAAPLSSASRSSLRLGTSDGRPKISGSTAPSAAGCLPARGRRQAVQQVAQGVQARPFFCNRSCSPYRVRRRCRPCKTSPPRPGCSRPICRASQVDRAQLPLFERLQLVLREAAALFGAADREPELEQVQPGAKTHHPLDPGAVVPAAAEQHGLAAGGQVLGVAAWLASA